MGSDVYFYQGVRCILKCCLKEFYLKHRMIYTYTKISSTCNLVDHSDSCEADCCYLHSPVVQGQQSRPALLVTLLSNQQILSVCYTQILDIADPEYKYYNGRHLNSNGITTDGSSYCSYEDAVEFTNSWTRKYNVFTNNCYSFMSVIVDVL